MTENVEESTKKGLVKWHSPIECNRDLKSNLTKMRLLFIAAIENECKQRKGFRFFPQDRFSTLTYLTAWHSTVRNCGKLTSKITSADDFVF